MRFLPSAKSMLSLLALLPLTSPVPKVSPPIEVRVWVENGPREACVDVLFVGDGYTKKQLSRAGKYWKDVNRCCESLFEEIPFSWYENLFNVRAAFLESNEKGCDKQNGVDEVDTALDSCFDTPSGRLLVFRNHEALKTVVKESGGADIVFVMVNTERYGGAGTTLEGLTIPGIYGPAPTFAAQDATSFLIAIHELGHSFGGLADEYVDDALHSTFLLPRSDDADLEQPNVTLAKFVDPKDPTNPRFPLKWRHFLDLPGANKYEWLHEGGFFRETGVFRPFAHCRMRTNAQPFCPVCCETLAKTIVQTCGGVWDDAAYHKEHPLNRRTWSRAK